LLYTPSDLADTTGLLRDYDVKIFGYPTDVFPRICFHTATYYKTAWSRPNEAVYIIGGATPIVADDVCWVWRLDLRDLSMQEMKTSGEAPRARDGEDRNDEVRFDSLHERPDVRMSWALGNSEAGC
jgi:hypothetical protein